MARRSHPFPSRTRQLSSSATEVVGPQGPARYVRRPVNILRTKPLRNERLFLFITPTNKDDLSSAQTARNLSRLPTDKSRLAITYFRGLCSQAVCRTRFAKLRFEFDLDVTSQPASQLTVILAPHDPHEVPTTRQAQPL